MKGGARSDASWFFVAHHGQSRTGAVCDSSFDLNVGPRCPSGQLDDEGKVYILVIREDALFRFHRF